MKYFLLALCVCITLNLHARSLIHDNQVQKLVIVDGPSSRLMDGDPLYRTEAGKKARYGFNPNEVLPYLLSTGWTIVDVHLHETRYNEYLFGYVVVEKIKLD